LFKSTGTKDKTPAGFGGRDSAPSILSGDLKITGDVVGGGELVIAGSVQGDIVAKKITVAEGGSVTGAVEADTVMVAGMLTGQLKAATVTLASTARVVADITHVSLMIESGAVFEGYSRRVDTIDQRGTPLPLALPAARPTVTTISGGKTNAGSEPAGQAPVGTPAAQGSVSTVS
jgi:cytoskeletal protein CcmA (bactofilin family)